MIIRTLAALFCLLSISLATEPIAISPIEAKGLLEHEIAALTDVLRSELSNIGEYNVLERGQMADILKEQGFQESGACSDASCAIEIGQLLAVKYMILGRIGKVGETYTLNIRLVDVGTGKIVKDIIEKQKGKIDNLLEESIPLAVKRLSSSNEEEITEEKRKKGPIIAGLAGGVVAAGAVAAIIIVSSKDDTPENKTVEVGLEW